MTSSELYEELRQLVQAEFADVVVFAEIMRLDSGTPRKLRLRMIDGSYADIFVSDSGRYSYHWERNVDDARLVYRHDNAPHSVWKHVATFPQHYHNGSEDNVEASYISREPQQAVRYFCDFIRDMLRRGIDR